MRLNLKTPFDPFVSSLSPTMSLYLGVAMGAAGTLVVLSIAHFMPVLVVVAAIGVGVNGYREGWFTR